MALWLVNGTGASMVGKDTVAEAAIAFLTTTDRQKLSYSSMLNLHSDRTLRSSLVQIHTFSVCQGSVNLNGGYKLHPSA